MPEKPSCSYATELLQPNVLTNCALKSYSAVTCAVPLRSHVIGPG
jgi:hypothetical protein